MRWGRWAAAAMLAAWPYVADAHELAAAARTPLRWTFDPGVIVPLLATVILYGLGLTRFRRRPSPIGGGTTLMFGAGMLALVVALISPLHALGSALFTAHMVQHEILMVVAAPLLVLGRPGLVIRAALPALLRRPLARAARTTIVRALATAGTLPLVAWSIHALALWIWHVPTLFDATLGSDLVHALQHVSFFASALLFWHVVLARRRTGPSVIARLVAIFSTSVHGAILGALLTFARTPWYGAYRTTTAAWGLTPLEDQQLGGLVMWIPAGVVYVVAALAIAARTLRAAPDQRRPFPVRAAAETALLLVALVASLTPGPPHALAASATGSTPRVYVSNERDGTITVIDVRSDRVVATWSVGGRPRGIRMTPDGRRVLTAVSTAIGNGPPAPGIGVFALDATSGKVLARYEVGTDPEQFAITPDGRELYAANEDAGTATAIALPAGRTLANLVTGTEPEGVAVRPDGTLAYVTSESSSTVTVIDTRRHRVASTFLVGIRPRDAVFTRDGAHAYVSAEIGNSVSVVDVKRHNVTATIALPDGARPAGVVLSPDDGTLYVATGRGNTVAIIDTLSRSVVGTIPVGQRVWGLGLTCNGRKLYAANGLSNDVSVIDTAQRAIVATIQAGDGPWGVAIGR